MNSTCDVVFAARPGLFDPKNKAKWDAWKKNEGMLHSSLRVLKVSRLPNSIFGSFLRLAHYFPFLPGLQLVGV